MRIQQLDRMQLPDLSDSEERSPADASRVIFPAVVAAKTIGTTIMITKTLSIISKDEPIIIIGRHIQMTDFLPNLSDMCPKYVDLSLIHI